MLFQMCYGPEIESIYEMIRHHPDCTIPLLKEWYQYKPEGDIRSLIEAVVSFLTSVGHVQNQNGCLSALQGQWDEVVLLQQFKHLAQSDETLSLDKVFVSMHNKLFVEPNRLFVRDMHYEVNQQFSETMVGKEKVNAWKRMMECFGLGYRAYSGFYALPHQRLMEKFIAKTDKWQGPLQLYCEENIHPFFPCVHQGIVFRGIIYGLAFLYKRGLIELTKKQDLPYRSYGEQNEWNWIVVKEGSFDVAMSNR